MKWLFALLLIVAPAPAFAEGDVALTNTVFVERIRTDEAGRRTIVLEPPTLVTPGDHVVFVLEYRNAGEAPATNFVVNNPVPDSVSFDSVEGEGAELSVDGGRSWGQLAALRVVQPDGAARAALAADVTHVRWRFARPIAAGASGRVSFRGTVK